MGTCVFVVFCAAVFLGVCKPAFAATCTCATGTYGACVNPGNMACTTPVESVCPTGTSSLTECEFPAADNKWIQCFIYSGGTCSSYLSTETMRSGDCTWYSDSVFTGYQMRLCSDDEVRVLNCGTSQKLCNSTSSTSTCQAVILGHKPGTCITGGTSFPGFQLSAICNCLNAEDVNGGGSGDNGSGDGSGSGSGGSSSDSSGSSSSPLDFTTILLIVIGFVLLMVYPCYRLVLCASAGCRNRSTKTDSRERVEPKDKTENSQELANMQPPPGMMQPVPFGMRQSFKQASLLPTPHAPFSAHGYPSAVRGFPPDANDFAAPQMAPPASENSTDRHGFTAEDIFRVAAESRRQRQSMQFPFTPQHPQAIHTQPFPAGPTYPQQHLPQSYAMHNAQFYPQQPPHMSWQGPYRY